MSIPHALAVHLSQLAIVPFLVRETNETEFPHELARALSSPPAARTRDADEDGVLSLFDLYITVARNVAQSYLEGELICTEHPLLDDNGWEGGRSATRLPHFRSGWPTSPARLDAAKHPADR